MPTEYKYLLVLRRLFSQCIWASYLKHVAFATYTYRYMIGVDVVAHPFLKYNSTVIIWRHIPVAI